MSDTLILPKSSVRLRCVSLSGGPPVSTSGCNSCGYKYEFFISYPRMAKSGQPHQVDEFAVALNKTLESMKISPLDIFLDIKSLAPGYDWKKFIPKALCYSRCMLLVYNDVYFTREYCVKEFEIMRQLELARGLASNSSRSLIVPLIVQSSARLSEQISRLSYVDFTSEILNPKVQFKNIKARKKVYKLIETAQELQTEASGPGVDCESYSFDQPIRAESPPATPFPGQWS